MCATTIIEAMLPCLFVFPTFRTPLNRVTFSATPIDTDFAWMSERYEVAILG